MTIAEEIVQMAVKINAKNTEGCLENVTLAYVKVKRPDNTDTDDPKYTATVITTVEDGAEYKKMFPKASVNRLTSDEVREKLKMEPPSDAPMHAVIKVRARATFKNANEKAGLPAGAEVPYDWPQRPKVYIPEGEEAVDRTNEVFVGNGSKGNVTFGIRKDAYGQTPDLREVLVTELVETDFKSGSMLGMPKRAASPQSTASVPAGYDHHLPVQRSAPVAHKVDDTGFPDI